MAGDSSERDYVRGSRAAWASMLRTCLRELGYTDSDLDIAKRLAEREEAIAQLRTLCEDFGDNEWDESLNLADIIDKYLGKHLHERKNYGRIW